MAMTAADVMVEILMEWGVEVIFGLPGDGINGIMEALRTRQDKIRFIQVRHEEAAAFMACAYAKYTGKTIDAIEHAMDRDKFLEADEAKEFGLIDEVFDKRPTPADEALAA